MRAGRLRPTLRVPVTSGALRATPHVVNPAEGRRPAWQVGCPRLPLPSLASSFHSPTTLVSGCPCARASSGLPSPAHRCTQAGQDRPGHRLRVTAAVALTESPGRLCAGCHGLSLPLGQSQLLCHGPAGADVPHPGANAPRGGGTRRTPGRQALGAALGRRTSVPGSTPCGTSSSGHWLQPSGLLSDQGPCSPLRPGA